MVVDVFGGCQEEAGNRYRHRWIDWDARFFRLAVKAPPSPPAPVPYTWTGFYAGIQFGGGWSHEAVNYPANDPASALLLSGGFTMTSQPVANGYRIPQSVLVGGFEADTTGNGRTGCWVLRPILVLPG